MNLQGDECEFFGIGGSDETITVTLHGQGKNNEFARLTVRRGTTAAELQMRVTGLLTQSPADFHLMNLGSRMGLVGKMLEAIATFMLTDKNA